MLIALLVSYSIIVGASVVHFVNNPMPDSSPTSTPEKQEKCGSVCRKN